MSSSAARATPSWPPARTTTGPSPSYQPPRPAAFNWALDWFDVVAATPGTAGRTALRVIEDDGSERSVSYRKMAARSTEVAAWLRAHGVERGHRVLLMLGNQVELWETMLACMKLGAVVIPATTLLTATDITDRVERGHVSHVITGAGSTGAFEDVPGDYTRIVVGGGVPGWTDYPAPGRTTRTARSTWPWSRGSPAATTRCCSTSRPGRRPSPSWSSTPTCPTRSGTCPRCTGSACARATSTSTSPPRAGPSTRGAPSSPRGTPRRRSSWSTRPGSTRDGCWRRWPRPGPRRSARRRPCTGC